MVSWLVGRDLCLFCYVGGGLRWWLCWFGALCFGVLVLLVCMFDFLWVVSGLRLRGLMSSGFWYFAGFVGFACCWYNIELRGSP